MNHTLPTLKAYLDLCRVSNLPTVWTNVLAAMLLATGAFHANEYLLLAFALSCFYLAGMSLNDLCDLEHDRVHRPGRPLPSGRVSTPGARLFTLVLFALGFLALALAPEMTGLVAGLALLAAIVAYDLRHKGNPLSVLIMAACRGLVFIVVGLALSGQLPPLLLAAAAVQFAWVVLVSLAARHENRRAAPYPFPLVPALIAGISLVDGLLMAALVAPGWLAAGLAGVLLTWAGQRHVRGD